MNLTQRAFTPHNAPIIDAKLLPVRAATQPLGRNAELRKAFAALKGDRAVLLHGRSGFGKSTLAAVLAAAYTAQSDGGVLWFTMVEDDEKHLVARVARAYALVALPNDDGKRADAVRALLEKRRPLIILDGTADMDEVRRFVTDVAAGTPTILMHDEPTDGAWTSIELGALPRPDSLNLLRALSGRLDTNGLEPLADALAGDPFALTVTGRYLAYGAPELADVASALRRDTSEPALALVFDALPSPEKTALLILGAAPSGGAGAELLAEMSGLPSAKLRPALKTLTERQLVEESINYGQARFTLHERTAAFVRSWMEAHGALETAQNRTLRAILEYAGRHSSADSADQDRLAAEIDNILGAAAYATLSRREESVHKLIDALDAAPDFAKLRSFAPELEQMRQLASLLEAPSAPVHEPEPPPLPVLIREPEPPLPVPVYEPEPPVIVAPPEPELILPPVEPDTTIATPIILSEPAPEPQALPPMSEQRDLFTITVPEPQTADAVPDLVMPYPSFIASRAEPDAVITPAPSPEPEPPKSIPVEDAPPRLTFALPPVATEPEADPLTLTIPELEARIERTPDKRAAAKLYNILGEKRNAQEQSTEAVEAYSRAVELWRAVEDWEQVARAMEKLGGAYIIAGQIESGIVTYRLALSIAYRANAPIIQGNVCFKLGRQLIDDQRTLKQAESLLAEAATAIPGSSEIDRLLRRARQRIERLEASNTPLPKAVPNNKYAALSPETR